MNLLALIGLMSIVGLLLAGPAWYLWSSGHSIIGGVLLAATFFTGVSILGQSRHWIMTGVGFTVGWVGTRFSYALLTSVFG
jgi:hypothetical protein